MTHHGWMLSQPNGAPFFWSDTKNYCIAGYALFKGRTARTPQELNVEFANLVREGWLLRQVGITIQQTGGGKPRQRRRIESEPESEPGNLPMRRIAFNPKRSDGA